MSRNSKKHLAIIGQPEFGFAEAFGVVRSAVLTIQRFTRSGKFNDRVDYGTWLAFHSPLTSAGLRVTETALCTVFTPVI